MDVEVTVIPNAAVCANVDTATCSTATNGYGNCRALSNINITLK